VRSNQPPAVASWLLRQFGSSPRNDSIIGDLNERYRQDRSRLWYWRQVISAIISSAFTEICTHKFMAVRAVLPGLILLHAIAKLMFNLFGRILVASVHSRLVSQAVVEEGSFPFWVFLLFAVVVFIVGIWSGWMAARFHRGQQPMVLLYGLATLIYLFGFAMVEGVSKSPLSGGHSLPFYCLNTAIVFAGILAGGSFCTASRPDAAPPQRISS
jgi:hypothetical protein